MKKNSNYYGLSNPTFNWHKLLLTMRLTFYLFMFGVLNLIASTSYSQNARVTVNMEEATVENVLNIYPQSMVQEEIDKVDLSSWIGSIPDEEENVIQTVEKIKNNPLISDEIIVHGLIIDIVTGELKVLVNGK